jgi:entericidin B
MELVMTKKIVTLVLVSCLAGLSACNTVDGAGKDLKSAGETVEDAAK